ncbi:MAG: hypothetical protein J0I43_02610 [Microbacterium sp.]|uniref:hypothetical protein n=1 Tax=Microbacterium sp. TaxID=51671 RepID=UPI001AC1F5D4|nr:hypothetical protein [Microbacterium sp.]MBN9176249.1 hypothetical protein [Microbacterium sp.]
MATLLLAGCSGTERAAEGGAVTKEQVQATAQQYKADGYPALAALLEDGVVDSDDYGAAANLYTSCLEKLGYVPGAPQINPTTSMTYIYNVQSDGRDPKVAATDEETCRVPNLSVVEAIYLNTNEQRIDESVRRAALECMAQKGFDIPDSARDIRAFSGNPEADGGAQRSAAATCITDEALKLFPDLPYVGVAY